MLSSWLSLCTYTDCRVPRVQVGIEGNVANWVNLYNRLGLAYKDTTIFSSKF